MTSAFSETETIAELDALTTLDGPIDASIEPPRHGILQVCHISMTLQTGGLERLLVEFARHADRRRFRLHFVALAEAGPPADDIRQLGLTAQAMGFPRTGKLGLIRSLKDFLQDHEIDVVHTHNTYAHFYGTLAARRAGVPVVVNTQHGRGCGDGWKNRLQFRIANRWTDRVVGVSEDATGLCRQQDRWAAGRTMRIWNGVDVSRFRYTGPQDVLTAISVARLSPEKDFPTLLRAVEIVIRTMPEFRLQIVGHGAERPGLEALTRELKLTEHVQFLGERSDVPELLAGAGFFVSSSRTEGVSLTLLEAMGVGLPIVTTAVGGSPEVVVDGTTGLIVPPENPQALADAILRMYAMRRDWNTMARAARERVERQFNIHTTMHEYESLYETLLKEKGL